MSESNDADSNATAVTEVLEEEDDETFEFNTNAKPCLVFTADEASMELETPGSLRPIHASHADQVWDTVGFEDAHTLESRVIEGHLLSEHDDLALAIGETHEPTDSSDDRYNEGNRIPRRKDKNIAGNAAILTRVACSRAGCTRDCEDADAEPAESEHGESSQEKCCSSEDSGVPAEHIWLMKGLIVKGEGGMGPTFHLATVLTRPWLDPDDQEWVVQVRWNGNGTLDMIPCKDCTRWDPSLMGRSKRRCTKKLLHKRQAVKHLKRKPAPRPRPSTCVAASSAPLCYLGKHSWLTKGIIVNGGGGMGQTFHLATVLTEPWLDPDDQEWVIRVQWNGNGTIDVIPCEDCRHWDPSLMGRNRRRHCNDPSHHKRQAASKSTHAVKLKPKEPNPKASSHTAVPSSIGASIDVSIASSHDASSALKFSPVEGPASPTGACSVITRGSSSSSLEGKLESNGHSEDSLYRRQVAAKSAHSNRRPTLKPPPSSSAGGAPVVACSVLKASSASSPTLSFQPIISPSLQAEVNPVVTNGSSSSLSEGKLPPQCSERLNPESLLTKKVCKRNQARQLDAEGVGRTCFDMEVQFTQETRPHKEHRSDEQTKKKMLYVWQIFG